MGVLSILFLSVLSGVVTVHYRDKVLKQQRTFYRDPTLITKPDGHTMKFGAILLLIGNVAMIVIQPTTVEVSHLLMFILFVVSVGLNIYFGSFLFEKTAYQGYDSHVESLKLAHHEWATIFNNVCIALLVSVGGVALGFMKPADGFLPADWATPRPLTS
jgi:hypothetical protein